MSNKNQPQASPGPIAKLLNHGLQSPPAQRATNKPAPSPASTPRLQPQKFKQTGESVQAKLESEKPEMELLSPAASATLGSGNLREIVQLPYGEDQNEWIAANIADFFHQVSMLYGMIAEHCTDEGCPRMTAGGNQEYFWSDSKGTLMEPCPANVYIDYLLSWVQEELDDENIFPSQIGKSFPANFLHIAKTIMKRLFRIYGHVYHSHFELIEQLKAVEHLNTSFKHFMLFVREFDLIDKRQLAPLQDLIQKLLPSEQQGNNGSYTLFHRNI